MNNVKLFKGVNVSLARAVAAAVESCTDPVEEEGGCILASGLGEFKFMKVLNYKTGTPVARGLYVADPDAFGGEVFPELSRGWNLYASFHTHPTFTATPSTLDRKELFRGFKYNYIYSIQEKTLSYSEWSPQNDLHIIYLNLSTLNYLSNE